MSRSCERCYEPAPATSVTLLGLGGEWSEIHLCERHADMLHNEVIAWLRYGEPVETLSTLGRGAADEPVPIPKPAPPPRLLIPPPAVCEPIEDEDDHLEAERYTRWGFTKHARQRMALRGIDERDALEAVEHPTVTRTQPDGTSWRQAGNIRVAVNPEELVIITVMRSDEEPEPPHNGLRPPGPARFEEGT